MIKRDFPNRKGRDYAGHVIRERVEPSVPRTSISPRCTNLLRNGLKLAFPNPFSPTCRCAKVKRYCYPNSLGSLNLSPTICLGPIHFVVDTIRQIEIDQLLGFSPGNKLAMMKKHVHKCEVFADK
ncbi:hypothetical protein F2P81_000348 [Scophthalmus maximus]|uniref:Uncharacterized protein n=1 Tax=Scophthalmus maximus TaxID=52904 RepID=A0A6A4TN24_SCOMX|nr:hypothetical protein F2P81_000348 [Scophthalmus maximus]